MDETLRVCMQESKHVGRNRQNTQTDNLVPLSPNVIWALIPAVAATLKNTVPTLKSIKNLTLTHKAPT